MRTKLFIITLFLGVISVQNSFSQTNLNDNLSSSRKFNSFSNPSYIAYRGGIGNIEKLQYEVCFIPTVTFQLKKYPDWGLEFTPQIVLRMFDQFSHPVITPSYIPKGTLFYHIQKTPEFKRDLFAFFTYGHHSNGQDGPLHKSDSVTINNLNGSFSANYLLGGVVFSYPDKKAFNPVSYMKYSASYNSIADTVVRRLYGRLRFFADLESTIKLSKDGENNYSVAKSKLTSSLHLGWIALSMYDEKPIDIKRLIFSYTLSYQPSFVNDLSLFARFYYGQDYYNINFERTLKLFQLGITIKSLHL
jgi:hypothetical protein